MTQVKMIDYEAERVASIDRTFKKLIASVLRTIHLEEHGSYYGPINFEKDDKINTFKLRVTEICKEYL